MSRYRRSPVWACVRAFYFVGMLATGLGVVGFAAYLVAM